MLLVAVLIPVLSYFVVNCTVTPTQRANCSLSEKYFIVREEMCIECYLTCYCREPHYQILKNNHSVEHENNTRVQTSLFKHDLNYFRIVITISNVSRSDSGQYTITPVSTNTFEESNTVDVKVFLKPEPTCSSTSSEAYSIFGDNVTIQCHVFTYPDLSFKYWTESNSTLKYVEFIDKSSGEERLFEKQFNIQQNVLVNYTCYLEVKRTLYSCKSCIPVKSRLNVSLAVGHVIVGNDAKLECSHSGNNTTQVQYVWTSSPKMINVSHSNTLIIRNVAMGLNGTEVRCTVSDGTSAGFSTTILLPVKYTSTSPVSYSAGRTFMYSKASTIQSDANSEDKLAIQTLLICSITLGVFVSILAILGKKYFKLSKKRVSVGKMSAIANIDGDTCCTIELDLFAPASFSKQLKGSMSQQLIHHQLPSSFDLSGQHDAVRHIKCRNNALPQIPQERDENAG